MIVINNYEHAYMETGFIEKLVCRKHIFNVNVIFLLYLHRNLQFRRGLSYTLSKKFRRRV